MPPLPVVPNVIKVQTFWTIGADIAAQTITHWQYSGSAPNATACTALAGDFETASTVWDGLYPTSNSQTRFLITDLSSTSGASGENDTAIPGERTGTSLPANCCVSIEWRTARRYRGGKGKSFMPLGVEADQLNNQLWGASFIAAVNAAAPGLREAFIGSSSGGCTITSQVIVSYYQGYNAPTTLPSGKVKQTPKLRVGGPVVDVVTGQNAAVKIASQRKRLGR